MRALRPSAATRCLVIAPESLLTPPARVGNTSGQETISGNLSRYRQSAKPKPGSAMARLCAVADKQNPLHLPLPYRGREQAPNQTYKPRFAGTTVASTATPIPGMPVITTMSAMPAARATQETFGNICSNTPVFFPQWSCPCFRHASSYSQQQLPSSFTAAQLRPRSWRLWAAVAATAPSPWLTSTARSTTSPRQR